MTIDGLERHSEETYGLESLRGNDLSGDKKGGYDDVNAEWTPQWTPVDQKTEGSNEQDQSTDLDEIISLWDTLSENVRRAILILVRASEYVK